MIDRMTKDFWYDNKNSNEKAISRKTIIFTKINNVNSLMLTTFENYGEIGKAEWNVNEENNSNS
jgi:hypothetical protein